MSMNEIYGKGKRPPEEPSGLLKCLTTSPQQTAWFLFDSITNIYEFKLAIKETLVITYKRISSNEESFLLLSYLSPLLPGELL